MYMYWSTVIHLHRDGWQPVPVIHVCSNSVSHAFNAIQHM